MTSRPTLFSKTPKAWMLLAQPMPIKRSVRAVLLLANGQRSEQELSMLLGTDVSDLVNDLCVQGCLQPAMQDLWDDDWEDMQVPLLDRTPTSRRSVDLRASA